MSNDTFELNTKNLDQIMKALKDKMSSARVGILGGKSIRGGGNSSTNASIGAVHEFGSEKMPMRSFLRVPITEHLQKELENSGAFSADELAIVVKEASMRPWLVRVAAIAEQIVRDAFDTGGFGKWPRWSKGYQSNTGQILVDTQQLRNSITSEVG